MRNNQRSSRMQGFAGLVLASMCAVCSGCKDEPPGLAACRALEKAGYAKDCRPGSTSGTWDLYGGSNTHCAEGAATTFSFVDSENAERRSVACAVANMQEAESGAKYMMGANRVLPVDHVFVVNDTLLVTIPLVKGYQSGSEAGPEGTLRKVLGSKITDFSPKPARR